MQVVGQRKAINIDIFHTPNMGWAVRNPPSYDKDYKNGIFKDYQGRIIPEGTALAVYSGELITTKEGITRG